MRCITCACATAYVCRLIRGHHGCPPPAHDETSLLPGCPDGTASPVASPHLHPETHRGHFVCRTSNLAPAQDLSSPQTINIAGPTYDTDILEPRTYTSRSEHHAQTTLLCFSHLANPAPLQHDLVDFRDHLLASPASSAQRNESTVSRSYPTKSLARERATCLHYRDPPFPRSRYTLPVDHPGPPPSNNNAKHHATPSK